MIRWLTRLLAWRKAAPITNSPFEVREFSPDELRGFAIEGAMSAGASRENAERFVAHLTGEQPMSQREGIRMILDRQSAPITDWDVAQASGEPAGEPGRIEYRFLGVTGEEDA